MDLPKENNVYKNVEYWNERFTKEENYDWCKKYEDFKHLLEGLIHKTDRILILGCGNSLLSEDLYNDGFRNITNIDYSEVVIDRMSVQTDAAKSMKWILMDATDMTFEDQSFDVVLEKATIDTFLVEEKDPWNISTNTTQLLDKMMVQVSRILKKEGRFISITFSQPHFRRLIYCRPEYNWSYECKTFGTSFHFFCYVMIKGQTLLPEHIPSPKKESSVSLARISDDEEDYIMKIAAYSEDQSTEVQNTDDQTHL